MSRIESAAEDPLREPATKEPEQVLTEDFSAEDIEGAAALTEIKQLVQDIGAKADANNLELGVKGIVVAIEEKLGKFDTLVRNNEGTRQLYNVDELMNRFKLLRNSLNTKNGETVSLAAQAFLEALENVQKH